MRSKNEFIGARTPRIKPTKPSLFEYSLLFLVGLACFYLLTLAVADLVKPVDFPSVFPAQAKLGGVRLNG